MIGLSVRCQILKLTLNKISSRSIQCCRPLGADNFFNILFAEAEFSLHQMLNYWTRQTTKTHCDAHIDDIFQNVPV